MLGAVSASPGHLLFIAPCAECQHLIPRLRASGWQVDSCDLADAGDYRVDVALVCVGKEASAELLQLPQRMRSSANQWLALVQAGGAPPLFEASGFADAWYFQRLLQPLDPQALQLSLTAACQAARSQVSSAGAQLLGHSKSIRDLRKRLDTLAGSRRPLLIEGEIGAGKGFLVKLLHQRMRGTAALRALTPEHLAENPCEGLRGGSLCLQQAERLAPATFDQVLKAAGRVNVRVLATTTSTDSLAHLREVCETVQLLPLRQRQGDIVLLAEHFAQLYSSPLGASRAFSESALSAMLQHDWPGNVRELAMRVRRALAMGSAAQVEASDLGLHGGFDAGPGATLEDYKRRAEYQALCDALARHSSNLSLAAKTLGISRPTFYRLLHKHQLL